jgi:uncharacterized membrane protein
VLAVGLVVAVVLALNASWELAVVSGWDAAAATFLLSVWHVILRADGDDTRRIASKEDDTRAVGNVLLVSVCMASLLGVGFVLSLAGDRTGALRAALIAVASVTIVLSWTTLNTIYALRYADLYQQSDGGITFGDIDGSPPPSYRDFVYVAFTIGMTYQVSDTSLRNPRIRRSVLAHAALAYVFGVVIVAGAINLIAGLVR